MKHLYETSRPKPNDLVAQYERLTQKGTLPSFCEKDFLSILDHYEQENNLENALTIINQALSQYKESGLLHLRKARILLYVKDIDKAFESLDRAEIFGQPNLEISLLRVRAYCYQEEYEVAKELLNQLKIQHFHIPENISEVYTMEAFMFEKQEKYEQMFDALKEAVLENPKNKEALGRIYFCVELSQKFHESVALHKQLLDMDSYAFMAWFNLAHAYYALGQYKLALDAFEYAILINDTFELAYLDCAELCYSLHIWDKALAHYQKLLTLLEPDEELLCRIGECYQKLGDYEHAKIYLYRALAMSPKYAKVYYLIGLCYAQENIWESSLHFFKQAAKLSPDRDDYLSALAQNHVKLGFPQKAIPLYKKAAELGPEIHTYWTELAHIYIERKKIRQALNLLEEALENTYDASIFYYQAACQFIQKDKSLALDTLREGLLEDYNQHHLLFELCPELKDDADIKGILRYYAAEFQ